MYMDILKNPIVIGIIAGVLSYLYFVWVDRNTDKKNKKKKDIGLFTPMVIAIVASVLSYSYLSNNSSEEVVQDTQTIQTGPVGHTLQPQTYQETLQAQQIKPIYKHQTQENMNGGNLRTYYNDMDVPQQTSIKNATAKGLTSESPTSFHLISKGLNIPNNLPDVFIETY